MSKLKVGFLTTHRCDNYGSVLQSFAFQTKLIEWGYDVELIDFYHKENTIRGQLESLKTKSMAVKNPIIYLIAYVVFGISYIKRKMVFNRYRNNNLKMTERTYSAAEEISENDPKEDIYCLGSDQTLNGIRRLEIFDNISNPMIKVSYASSFGRSIFSEDELKRMKRSLVDFQLLSCREKTGLEIMNHMQIKNVNWNIDPAFLMTADEWRKHMKAKYTGGYIAIYNLHHDRRIEKLQKVLSRCYHLPVYNICNLWFEFYRYGKFIYLPSVENFLGIIDRSEYIITDSFHVTVFSVLFHKKFLVIRPEGVESRIESLMDLLDLKERMVDWSNEGDYLPIMDKDIDYLRIDQIIEEERKKAKHYVLSWKEICKNEKYS